MNIHVDGTGTEGQAATVELFHGDTAHVLHPSRIIAYQGSPQGREDRILNLSGMYRKKKNGSNRASPDPPGSCSVYRWDFV